MARIRTIKPEFWESEKVGRMSHLARLTFMGLISLADDEGRGRGSAGFLLGRLHPYATLVAGELDAAMAEISGIGLANWYEGPDGCQYYSIPGFSDNQFIQRPSKSKFPVPPTIKHSMRPHGRLTEPSRRTHGSLTEGSRLEGKGREGKGKDVGASPKQVEIVDADKHKVRRVVEAYKHSKNIDMNDKAWDRANFSRACKAAKSLLDCFAQDMDKCAAYIFLRAEDLNEAGLTWTLETVARHAWDGIGIEIKGENGSENSAVGADSLHGPGRTRRITSSREIARETLGAIKHAGVHDERDGDVPGPRKDSGLLDEDVT